MGTLAVPDRVRWAVDRIDPMPDSPLLEVGCGPGGAAELICPRLTTGRLTAIDRSATATARTSARNAHYIETARGTAVRTGTYRARPRDHRRRLLDQRQPLLGPRPLRGTGGAQSTA